MTDAPNRDARRDRARGCLLALAAGDALGRPVTGETAAAVRDRHGRVTDLLGGDRPAGTTTAPTAAAVAAARRLVGDMDGAIGRGQDRDRTDPDDPGARLAAAAPFGLPEADAGRRAAVVAERAATTLDGDADAVVSETCAALAVLVGGLCAGEPMADALDTTRRVAVDRGAPVGLRETLSVVGDHAAVTLDTRGGVAATFETALHEAVVADGPEEAVVSAASRGGRASALGAVAGAVAGARAGEDGVPARWLNDLDGVADLRALADALADATLDGTNGTFGP
ncbi:ADP-ribosylglycohydrolase family protein [Halobaculum sp. EA56]|uniref:ADP-ribosylglycohydrolase family protein n=1 Tax=Halobaculum sp. EA56 TaxID=3421648 RepID=UPI003EB99EE0